jgi:phosphatidylinositol alpha 1,6-mannosyltransferase
MTIPTKCAPPREADWSMYGTNALSANIATTPPAAHSALRVALFSGNYNYVRDGANQALNRLVDHLEKVVGATVRVYSATSAKPAFEPSGTLISVPSLAFPGRGEYRLALGLPKRIKDDIAAFQPNVFHLSAPDWLGAKAQRFAKELGIPVVTSLHTRFETYLEYYGLNWARARMERYLATFYGSSDMVLVPTQSILETFRTRGFGDRVQLWGRGVDPNAFDPALRSLDWRRAQGIADQDIVVLFFGRLVKEKGLADFAALLAAAKSRNVLIRPLFVGDGPARAWARQQLPDAVFAGYLSGLALGRAVASADIFVNPSKTEAFGNVTLEAMASGLAVICADVPSGRSLIADAETGLLCPTMTADSYATLLERLVSDAEQRKRLAAQARKVSKAYSWPETLETVVNTYRNVTGLR